MYIIDKQSTTPKGMSRPVDLTARRNQRLNERKKNGSLFNSMIGDDSKTKVGLKSQTFEFKPKRESESPDNKVKFRLSTEPTSPEQVKKQLAQAKLAYKRDLAKNQKLKEQHMRLQQQYSPSAAQEKLVFIYLFHKL